ncbi:MrcB family domain-containing protein [Nitratiruptor tergarcus]|uniref:5-methylcytosine-specific restriction endonuclease McrBC, GTP-binding regulatory subunit McrB n=1 Tax=Nitratiruptor tergarcus DSM 16512 TaxID=1069081 RepID=A0A1W1WTW5_9BACT|nr:DUF3578 domain-containing protein [Nitratiruptor tergarcus]SMC09183.1 5-methylcytosine-specific restriction endonuclease McrBC, GTP-binding regulatory subunit McrB [Nitratiruptor tergarcus DSM 16512]
MSRIALGGAVEKESSINEMIKEIDEFLNKNKKISLWWSYPIKHCKEDYEKEKPFWFYLYQDKSLKARYRVIDFKTKEGDEGIECPQEWEKYLLNKTWAKKKRLSGKRSEIFKTWFLIDKIEKLENEISIDDLISFCNQPVSTNRLVGSFLYIYEPLFSKNNMKQLIKKFIKESIEKNTLGTKNYKTYYEGLETKVSFGQGQQADISWMAFLRFNQTVSKGIYPVILFNRKDCLVLAYGVSETENSEIKWPDEIINNYKQIKETTCECNLSKIKEKYPNSYLKKCYKLEDGKLKEEQLEDVLNNLDEIIKSYIATFSSKPPSPTNEINCFENSNLKLDPYIKNSFYNSLKTKGFVILAGLSGTGKTKIFEEFVNCFPNAENNLFFPIRPDFKDTKSLLGFYNPLKNQYHSTPLLDFIVVASKNYLEKGKNADPFFVLFDEMNLAKVEYYFADFLSVLEVKRFDNENETQRNHSFQKFLVTLGKNTSSLNEENYNFTSQSIKLHNEDINDTPKELFLPPNLYFVGTVNIDETTHMFSPKVLDRAFTIEFNVGSFEDYLEFLQENFDNKNSVTIGNLKEDFINNGEFAVVDKQKIREFLEREENRKYLEILEKMNNTLRKYNLHFGYRVFDEIIMFLYNSQDSQFKFDNPEEAFDLAVKMKVLPKLHGTRQKLEKPIISLLKQFEIESPEEKIKEGIPQIKEIRYKHTVQKLLEMLYKLKIQGFASFM